MPEKVSLALLWRLALGAAFLVFASACGSTGCQGCGTQTIPGGFPQQHRFDNGMQVRVAQGGIQFVEKNFSTLIKSLVPGGLSFTIPPTGCSSGSQKICCSGPTCTATMSIASTKITPTPASTLQVDMNATVKTTKIKFEQKVVLVWISCDVEFDSARSGTSTLGLTANIDLVVEASNYNKLKISRGSTTLKNFESGDIKISGGVVCTVVDWLKGLFKGTIEKQLTKTLDDTLDSMLKTLPLGQEGRFDVASFMSTFSPRTKGEMDYFLWAGGHAKAESYGMSVGVMGGFRAAKQSACVPDCEKTGAKCKPPQKAAISWSTTFQGNTRPDGKSFDVGIGVHRQALDIAAYAMYSSGGLCLDVGSETVPQLSSSMLGFLLQSLNTLTGGNNNPMMIAVRPRNPPTVLLDKGTYTTVNGKPVITKPLLKIKAKDFAIDMYVMVDERLIRVFTVVTDLEVPALLYADSKGDLQPMLGDLKNAMTNIRIENADLITDDTSAIKTLLPTLFSMASGSLSSSLQPIQLPALQGLKLVLDSGSITSVDQSSSGYDVLAIFANLALASSTTASPSPSPFAPDPVPPVETEATLVSLKVPGGGVFSPGPDSEPTLVLGLSARHPGGLAGREVEYAYRIDGTFYHSWVTGDHMVIQDPLLWLQGRHTVEVMARLKDDLRTIDPTPVKIPVVIDNVPPAVRLVPVPGGVRAEVEDFVSGPGQIRLSWSIDGSAFGSFGTQRTVSMPPGVRVAVRAQDAAGNESTALSVVGAAVSVASPDIAEGGCAVAGPRTGRALALFPLLLLLVLGWIRRR